MADSAPYTAASVLHITRIPGEHGPVVRCSGDLSLTTLEPLRRELDLLASMRYRVLVLDLSDGRSLDVDGVLVILETHQRLRKQGQRLVLVAKADPMRRLLRELGIDWLIPVFPTKAAAELALPCDGPPEAVPVSQREAREATLATWRAILAGLYDEPAEDLMGRIAVNHGLCRLSEETLKSRGDHRANRCHPCPLFEALGGRPEDVGCRSGTQPMLDALRAGDRSAARTQVARLIELIEEMPLSQE